MTNFIVGAGGGDFNGNGMVLYRHYWYCTRGADGLYFVENFKELR